MGDFNPPPQKLKVFRAFFHEVYVAICASMKTSPLDFDLVADLKHIFTQGRWPKKFLTTNVMSSPPLFLMS